MKLLVINENNSKRMDCSAGILSAGRRRKVNQNPTKKTRVMTSAKWMRGVLFEGFAGQENATITGALRFPALSRIRYSNVREYGESTGRHISSLISDASCFCADSYEGNVISS